MITAYRERVLITAYRERVLITAYRERVLITAVNHRPPAAVELATPPEVTHQAEVLPAAQVVGEDERRVGFLLAVPVVGL